MDTEIMSAREAFDAWFRALDAEAWDEVADALDEDAELADDLTTEWLRGRERVGSYLRAQQGIVTEIVTRPTRVTFQDLGAYGVLATFELTQRYRLSGTECTLSGTGCVLLRRRPDGWRLALFQLAATDPSRAAEEATETAPTEAADAAPPLGGAHAAPGTLGEEIRRRRTHAGFSLRELADRAQLSPSFLSQVERSQADPSVSSLRQIAEGLSTELAALLGAQASTPQPFRRGTAGDRARFRVSEAGIIVEGFAGFPDGELEAYIVEPTLGAAGWTLERAAAEEELIFVLDGTLELDVGHARVVLEPRDGIQVRSGTSYRLSSSRSVTAPRYLVVQVRGQTAARSAGRSESSTITPSGLST